MTKNQTMSTITIWLSSVWVEMDWLMTQSMIGTNDNKKYHI
jgi:hypothetical protein